MKPQRRRRRVRLHARKDNLLSAHLHDPLQSFSSIGFDRGTSFSTAGKGRRIFVFPPVSIFLFVIRDVHYFWPTLVVESSSVLDMMKLAC